MAFISNNVHRGKENLFITGGGRPKHTIHICTHSHIQQDHLTLKVVGTETACALVPTSLIPY